MTINQLIAEALQAKEQAYAPYSKFSVGAALRTHSQKIYTGCNIENAAYSMTCCAERVAIFKALSAGEKNFVEMAIVADTKSPISPCGACRQVMSEFFKPTVSIHLTNRDQLVKTVTIADLLPFSFKSTDLTD